MAVSPTNTVPVAASTHRAWGLLKEAPAPVPSRKALVAEPAREVTTKVPGDTRRSLEVRSITYMAPVAGLTARALGSEKVALVPIPSN